MTGSVKQNMGGETFKIKQEGSDLKPKTFTNSQKTKHQANMNN